MIIFSQGERPLQMQYFPSDRRLDKMFFPYYGKKAHVSKTDYSCFVFSF